MPARRALLIFLILLTLRMTAREGETPLLPARPAAPMPGGEPPASPPTKFRVYLPLVARQGSEAPPRVDFGLVFITSAEWPADPDRFDRARRLGARWDRWPLYWSGVEISPGVYRWASVDTALRDALAQGFEVSLILLGTPGFYATGGLPLRPPVGGSILRRSEARTPGAPIAIAAASPPAGLYAPIFTDSTDRLGPGKTINPENPWCPLTTVSTGPIIVDEYRARRFPMGRKKQIDTSMYFCPHTDCPNYGKVGPDNQIVGAGRYGKANTQLLRCKVCGRTFSARRGTPLFGLKASEETFYDVIACLAEGNGIRATARIKGVDKDTVAEWLDTASKHVEAVSRYLMVNLHFEEAQLDEFWSFVQKKRRAVPLLNGSRPNMATVGSG
jgi:transposase-like protein